MVMPNSSSPFKTHRTQVATLQINRRRFIYSSALAAGALAIGLPAAIGRSNYKSPNEKLNLGGIGVGGQGAADVKGLFNGGSENVIALCDVDENSLNAALQIDSNGSLFIGDNGKIIASTYGERPHLLPESRMADYQRPAKTLARVPGNSPYQDFIRACKGGPPACSNFDVSGPFTEWVLLGNLAIRVGGKLEWDPARMKVKNMPDAGRYIHKHYRHGWKV